MSSAVSTLPPNWLFVFPFSRMLSRWSPATDCVTQELGVVGVPFPVHGGSTVISWSPVAVEKAVIAAWRSPAPHSVKPSVCPVPSKPWPVTS